MAVATSRTSLRTSPRTHVDATVGRPGIALRLPVLMGVTVVAHLRARWSLRSGDFATCQRDESSPS